MTVYIPFGSDCAVALALRISGLRKESLPFDWVFGTPENIKRSLELNFSDWFDDSIEIIEDTYVYDDLINENTTTKYMTRHPNYPVHRNISEGESFFRHMDFSDPGAVASMKKRIDRFNVIRESKENIVLVTSIPYDQIISYGLLDYFNKDRKIYIVIVEHVKKERKKVKLKKYQDYYRLRYSSLYSHDLEAMDKVAQSLRSLNL